MIKFYILHFTFYIFYLKIPIDLDNLQQNYPRKTCIATLQAACPAPAAITLVFKLWQSNPKGKFIAKIFRTAYYSCLLMKTNNSKL